MTKRNLWTEGAIPYSPSPRSKTQTWFGTDSIKNFKPTNSRYGPDDVEYTFNSYGFRSPEIDLESTNKKIMFAGCSNTQGIGLPWDHMWATKTVEHLKQFHNTEIEHHNFAMAGHGNDSIAMMVYQVVPILKPDLLIVQFTGFERMTYHHGVDDTYIFGSWKTELFEREHKAFITLQNDYLDFYRWRMAFSLIDSITKVHNIPWIYQVEPEPVVKLPDTYRQDNLLPFRWKDFYIHGDLARDGIHVGPIANGEYAEALTDYLTDRDIL